jgi:NhaP-type Na+/H+ or K+/H+ antiporter
MTDRCPNPRASNRGALAVACLTGSLTAVMAAIAGALIGYLDVVLLGRVIDFEPPKGYQTLGQMFVWYIPIAVNALALFLFVCFSVLVLVAGPRKRSTSDSRLVRLVRSAVLGGAAGALLGVLDIYLLAQFLTLANSDNAAVWRENRSWVVIFDAFCGSLFGITLLWRL